MDTTTLKGDGQEFGGKVKEGFGDAIGDQGLRSEGAADQLTGSFNQAIGAAKDAFNGGTGPLVNQAKDFARKKPWATAALVGVVGLAVMNTLRGKK